MSTVDVTVLGGGVFGLSVAWACLQRGAKVRVIDRHGIGTGSSGGLVGALAPHTPEMWDEKKQFQFESLIMSRKFWPEVEAISGQSTGYTRAGRLQPVMDERSLELAWIRERDSKDLWQGLAEWEVVERREGDDWQPFSKTGYLIKDTLSAHIHPRMAVQALAAGIKSRGGEIVIGVASSEGKVVHATGFEGLLELAEVMDQPVGNGVKGQALAVRFNAQARAQLFSDGLHVVPHRDGTVAIGSTSEREFDDPSGTDDKLDSIYQRAISAFPVLKDAPIVERWAGVRPRTKSLAPMLGAHPLRREEFIANGGFKIGFGMAPKAGEAMADLLLEGCDKIPDSLRVEASLRP